MNSRNLISALKETSLTAAQITERSGCSSQSVYNACKEPEKIKEGTVLALCAAMAISFSGIISAKVDPDYVKKHFLSMRLEKLQEEHGFSLKEIAELSEISQTALSGYVNGKRLPTETTLEKIAETFDVNPAWLIGDVDVPDSKKQIEQRTAVSKITLWLEQKAVNSIRLAVDAHIEPSAFKAALNNNALNWAQINAVSRIMKCRASWLAGLSYVGAFPGYPAGLKCKFLKEAEKGSTSKPDSKAPVKEPAVISESAKTPIKETAAVKKEEPSNTISSNPAAVLSEVRSTERTICGNRDLEGRCSVGERLVSDAECDGCPFYEEASIEVRVSVLEKRCFALEETVRNLAAIIASGAVNTKGVS